MANNYTQASFAIPVKDAALTKRRMEALEEWVDKTATAEPDPQLPEDLFGPKASEYTKRLITNVEAYGEGMGYLGFSWDVDDDGGDSIVLYHEESIDLEAAIAVAQILLDLDDDDGVYTMEWANVCSKPRVGEFSGGAVAFNRREASWKSTWTLADELKAALENRLA